MLTLIKGASSNHALFWSLTATVATLGHRRNSFFKERLKSSQNQVLKPTPYPFSKTPRSSSQEASLPTHDTAVQLISRFFDTIGATLAHVSESAILDTLDKLESGREPSSTRTAQALLNIVFAHALSVEAEGPPELYYEQDLNLLDLKTLYVPSLELSVYNDPSF